MKIKVTLVENDPTIAFMLVDGLECEGFDVAHIREDENLLKNIQLEKPDVILLDVELDNGMNGFDIGRQVRKFNKEIPIIFTTARTQYEDMKEGYSIGNVDYVKKPYTVRELILHINEMISRRRFYAEEKESYTLGNFAFFPNEQLLKLDEEEISVTKSENIILTLLSKNKNRVLSKEELVIAVWNETDPKIKENSLNNLIYALRIKLERDPSITIITIPKGGYKLTF